MAVLVTALFIESVATTDDALSDYNKRFRCRMHRQHSR